jgi:hypothetical protein
MSDDPPQDPPQDPPKDAPPETVRISPEVLASLFAASAMPLPGDPPSDNANPGGGNRAMRRKVYFAVAVATLGVGASIMSCVGQSFSFRQARAMEGIEQQLKEIRATCTVAPRVTTESPK